MLFAKGYRLTLLDNDLALATSYLIGFAFASQHRFGAVEFQDDRLIEASM
jgi:hypothetical protein